MWLEIDGDTIIGTHSDKCESSAMWVEYDGEATPGDRWMKNKVIPQKEDLAEDEKKRIAARARIVEFYPEWKQLNILREGDATSITKMGIFIDACRAWSNDATSEFTSLEKIIP